MFTEKVHLEPQSSGKYRGLSAARQNLLRVMQEHPYSRIDHLTVVSGDPVFGPGAKIIAETKFGAADGPRREAGLADFVMKKEHVELFQQLEKIGSGELLTLEVKGGLPFRMIREIAA
jgi:hypothetical protein